MSNMRIGFNYNSMMSASVGKHGFSSAQLRSWQGRAKTAQAAVKAMAAKPKVQQPLETYHWTQLPFQDHTVTTKVAQDLLALGVETLVSLGIGGSFLGNVTLHESLRSPYWNDFAAVRDGYPRIFFQGMNLDPAPVDALLKNLEPKKSAVVVISKSGTTTETATAFATFKEWLGDDRRIIAVSDSEKGVLRPWVKAQGIKSLPVPSGVGGRYSVLSPVGLITAALTGIDIKMLLAGAANMYERTVGNDDINSNPALMYALLHTIAYKNLDKDIAVMMPFSEQLKSFGEWYVQLLAESLGKKFDRQGREVFNGRTPIPSMGNRNLHADQQNNVEGEPNKVVTFIGIEHHSADFVIQSSPSDFLIGKNWTEIFGAALTAARADMTSRNRPNCLITLPTLNPYTLGQLIFMMELATAYEGELLDINAFDQPGVEGYKNRMYGKLGRPGFEKAAEEVDAFEHAQDPRFII